MREQTSSEAHDGHGGDSEGQLAHRRNRWGALKSTSTQKTSALNPPKVMLSVLTKATEAREIHLGFGVRRVGREKEMGPTLSSRSYRGFNKRL